MVIITFCDATTGAGSVGANGTPATVTNALLIVAGRVVPAGKVSVIVPPSGIAAVVVMLTV
jgi:hypothetical protein